MGRLRDLMGSSTRGTTSPGVNLWPCRRFLLFLTSSRLTQARGILDLCYIFVIHWIDYWTHIYFYTYMLICLILRYIFVILPRMVWSGLVKSCFVGGCCKFWVLFVEYCCFVILLNVYEFYFYLYCSKGVAVLHYLNSYAGVILIIE